MSRIERLRQLLEKTPGDADLHYMLAQEHAKAGDHDAAIEQYDACLNCDDAYLYAYFHKAASQESAGRAPDAKQTLEFGLARAESAGDAKAISEIGAYLRGIDA